MILDYLARGPVAEVGEWPEAAGEGPTYIGAPRCRLLLPPLQVFGVHYAEDIAIEPRHPHWQMHEWARISRGGEALWLAKHADHRGLQSISADLEDLEGWLPEVPLSRHRAPVAVEEETV